MEDITVLNIITTLADTIIAPTTIAIIIVGIIVGTTDFQSHWAAQIDVERLINRWAGLSGIGLSVSPETED